MNKEMPRRAGCPLTVAAALLLLFLAKPAVAEVGVAFDPGQDSVLSLYELVSIIEDGDPVGIYWRPHTSPTSGRVVLNSDGETDGDGRPCSLFNRFSQMPMVAWAESTATGYDVVISHFSSGAWSAPEVLCANATVAIDPEPQLTVNPSDGSVHIVYWMDESSPRVVHRQAPADLSTWSAPQQVSVVGEIALRPAAVFHQGQLRVAYEAHAGQIDGTPRFIMLATEDGGGFVTEVLATTNHDEPNRPRVHSGGGNLWVEWIDAAGEMTWMSRVLPDPWSGVELEPYGSVEERDFHVRREIRTLVLD